MERQIDERQTERQTERQREKIEAKRDKETKKNRQRETKRQRYNTIENLPFGRIEYAQKLKNKKLYRFIKKKIHKLAQMEHIKRGGETERQIL